MQGKNSMFNNFLKQIIKQINSSTYKCRGEILYNLFSECAHLNNDIHFSYVQPISCPGCSHLRIISMPIISLGIDSSNDNINLDHLITNYLSNIKKSYLCVKKECGQHTIINSNYIFVELFLKDNVFSLQLEKLPKNISLENRLYTLGGLVAYSGASQHVSRKKLGHFTAYCCRINGKWEKYDDLKTKKEDCSESSDVFNQVMFFRL